MTDITASTEEHSEANRVDYIIGLLNADDNEKELAVGLLNGFAWAVVVAIVTYAWFQDTGIALIIAAAMILNLIAAAFSGVLIPVILARMGIDPALSGAVVLTTVTDIIGFLSFPGLATLFLL